MSERVLSARTIQIHDIESNWLKAISFIPRKGEIVVYDVDETHSTQRFKLGDGTTLVNELPFTVESEIEAFFSTKDKIFYIDSGRISDYEN